MGRFARIVRATPILFVAFLHFCIYILHTRPDPIAKRFSAVPHYEWRDGSYICLPINLLGGREIGIMPASKLS